MLIFMVGPGILGSVIDRWLQLSLFTPIGFGIGIALATVALLVLAKHFAPPAGGKPLSDANLNEEEAREEAERDDPPRKVVSGPGATQYSSKDPHR